MNIKKSRHTNQIWVSANIFILSLYYICIIPQYSQAVNRIFEILRLFGVFDILLHNKQQKNIKAPQTIIQIVSPRVRKHLYLAQNPQYDICTLLAHKRFSNAQHYLLPCLYFLLLDYTCLSYS